MGPEERDLVDMANNVLLKCHINLRLERISECDANVFVALYEAILGEKVPDYVAAERQEDDIHNVQSVIDSLALDYLQISLSHITGENIVRGEKESIKNLLEIFDGLLDYLIEQQSDEEPQHKGDLYLTNSFLFASAHYLNKRTEITRCSDRDGSLSLHSQRNREAEQELHDMSEKLSRRLEELDLVSNSICGCFSIDLVVFFVYLFVCFPNTKGTNTISNAITYVDCYMLSVIDFLWSANSSDNNLLPILLEEFPRVQLSPHTLSRMWKQQLRQIDQLSSSQNQNRQTQSKLLKQLEEAQKRHDMLVQIIHKEKEHNRRLREFRERIQQQKSAQNKLREQRQQVARAKKYYSVYHVQLRARLMQAKTQEEQLKQIFEEGLELQKAHLREQRAYTKELRQENYRKYKYEIEAMENYYRDQFSLLAETLAHERQDIQIRKKAQEKALQKMKRELRNKTEKEIGELQKVIIQNDENNYFRDLDVERLQKRVQMASFQYTTSCLQ
uniref:DUF5745 domain-containing protein n=1 Tax=Sinocyclocheilus grahami TaxID=75366 RepID=A0A672L7G3_SINGR